MTSPITVLDIEQRSEAWHRARCGFVTGTCAEALLAEGKSTGKAGAKKQDEAITRRDLRLRVAAEQVTGVWQEEGFVSEAMERGSEKERACVAAYEAATRQIVFPVGFVVREDIPFVGCSPDGRIGQFAGIVELKNPKTHTHLKYLRTSEIPTGYMRQIRHNLFVTGADWCDFVSFDDRLPPALQLVRLRVRREDADLKAYEAALLQFLADVKAEVEALHELIAERSSAA